MTALSCGSLVSPHAVSAQPAAAAGGGRGTNILIVGIDSRAGLSRAEKNRLHVGGKGCNCTDVMMLVHLSEDRHRASIVSIPRDSYVEYAGTAVPARSGKINGAFALGGGPLTVATVEKATGLHVDHYLETGFAGFEQTVDNLGGGTVCTDRPLTDENSGLDIGAGRHHTDGNTTLRYARARHVNLRPGDLGRVRRQQRVVNDLLARLTFEGALASPVRTARTVHTLLKTVRTDARTGPGDLIGIGWALGRLRADRTEFATVPIRLFDHRVPGWAPPSCGTRPGPPRCGKPWARTARSPATPGSSPSRRPLRRPTPRPSRSGWTTPSWPRPCAATASPSPTPPLRAGRPTGGPAGHPVRPGPGGARGDPRGGAARLPAGSRSRPRRALRRRRRHGTGAGQDRHLRPQHRRRRPGDRGPPALRRGAGTGAGGPVVTRVAKMGARPDVRGGRPG